MDESGVKLQHACSASAEALTSACRRGGYKHVDWRGELKDMQRDTRKLARDEFVAHSMRHRFCVVAAGDFISTPKTGETIAIAAAGGCLPLFVLPNTPWQVHAMLPYTDWLDYCSIGVIVFEDVATRDMASIVERLLRLSAVQADAIRDRIRNVSQAFIFRKNSNVSEPSAAEFALEAACHAARRLKRNESSLGDELHSVESLYRTLQRCAIKP